MTIETAKKKLQAALTNVESTITVTIVNDKQNNEVLKIDASKCSRQIQDFIGFTLKDLFEGNANALLANNNIAVGSYTLNYPTETYGTQKVPSFYHQNQIDTYFLMTLPEDFFTKLMLQEMQDYSEVDQTNQERQTLGEKYTKFVQNCNSIPKKQYYDDFNSRKKEIIATIKDSYPWRPSIFGHHHNKRRDAVCKAIQSAVTMQQIRFILDNQLHVRQQGTGNGGLQPISQDLLFRRFSHEIRNPRTEESGYFTAIQKAHDMAEKRNSVRIG